RTHDACDHGICTIARQGTRPGAGHDRALGAGGSRSALPHVRLLSFAEMKEDAHLALQPFGQIPTYEEDGISLFESGAIVLHISQNRPGLMPAAPHRRARAISWLLAAVGTVEPPIAERE